MKRLNSVVGWLVDGGFGMLVYGLFTVLIALGTIVEIASHGFTDLAGVEAFLAVGMIFVMFSRN